MVLFFAQFWGGGSTMNVMGPPCPQNGDKGDSDAAACFSHCLKHRAEFSLCIYNHSTLQHRPEKIQDVTHSVSCFLISLLELGSSLQTGRSSGNLAPGFCPLGI